MRFACMRGMQTNCSLARVGKALNSARKLFKEVMLIELPAFHPSDRIVNWRSCGWSRIPMWLTSGPSSIPMATE